MAHTYNASGFLWGWRWNTCKWVKWFISFTNEGNWQSIINTDTQKERICWDNFVFTFYDFKLFMQQYVSKAAISLRIALHGYTVFVIKDLLVLLSAGILPGMNMVTVPWKLCSLLRPAPLIAGRHNDTELFYSDKCKRADAAGQR